MRLFPVFIPLAAVAVLAGCEKPATPQDGALCARADIKDAVLDSFARSFTGKNANILALLDSTGTISEALIESFKTRTTIEAPQGVADGQQINCTVTIATTNSEKDPTPVEFRAVKYALVPNADGTYRIITEKGTFFRQVFINGMPKDAWDTQQAQAAASAATSVPPEVSPSPQINAGDKSGAAKGDDECPYTDQSECAAEAAPYANGSEGSTTNGTQ